MNRHFIQATAVAGALDLLAAMGITLYFGKRSVGDMLRFVASGPVPSASDMGAGGAVLGVIVHFVLMAVMVALYFAASRRWPALHARPIASGVLYGLITYVVMNVIVVPLRWPEAWPPSATSIITQLFCHIVLVGIPIALFAARGRGLRDWA